MGDMQDKLIQMLWAWVVFLIIAVGSLIALGFVIVGLVFVWHVFVPDEYYKWLSDEFIFKIGCAGFSGLGSALLTALVQLAWSKRASKKARLPSG